MLPPPLLLLLLLLLLPFLLMLSLVPLLSLSTLLLLPLRPLLSMGLKAEPSEGEYESIPFSSDASGDGGGAVSACHISLRSPVSHSSSLLVPRGCGLPRYLLERTGSSACSETRGDDSPF